MQTAIVCAHSPLKLCSDGETSDSVSSNSNSGHVIPVFKRRRLDPQSFSSYNHSYDGSMPPTAVPSVLPVQDPNINFFKEKKLKVGRSGARNAAASNIVSYGQCDTKPTTSGVKRKVEDCNQYQSHLSSSSNKQSTSKSDGDYHIVVGEELRSMGQCYEVLSFLGRGTFGQVVKAWKRNSNELVAIKILKNHPSYARQGHIEIQILQQLSKEDTNAYNIVRALECFSHKSHMCLVFELLEQNLYDYLKAQKFRPLSLREIRPITYQVLTALSKLKSLGLIHADLKPENIMIVNPHGDASQKYKVKVIDFGSACYTHKAVTSTYLQSRYYRAPEILLGLPFNESIDVWSLGCVIAELFLGWPLYPGSSEYDQVRYIVETQGFPPANLLSSARKTSCFFSRQPYTGEFLLKSAEQYFQETLVRSKEVRKYKLASLDDIGNQITLTGETPMDVELERADRAQFTRLLRKMLHLEGRERVAPDVALQQHFLTMRHLQQFPHSKLSLEAETLMKVCYRHQTPPAQLHPYFFYPQAPAPPPPDPSLLYVSALPALSFAAHKAAAFQRAAAIHQAATLAAVPLTNPLLVNPLALAAAAADPWTYAAGLWPAAYAAPTSPLTLQPSLNYAPMPPSMSTPEEEGRSRHISGHGLHYSEAASLPAPLSNPYTTGLVTSRHARHPVQIAVCHPFNVKDEPQAYGNMLCQPMRHLQ